MNKTDSVRLQHMIDAAHKAIEFSQGYDRATLDQDEMRTLAIVRLVEILGEAAKQISEPLRQAHPEVPWRQMAGTRDRLTHAYFEVDLDVIWGIVNRELPILVKQLEDILNMLEP
jgi:uncharacterized protein with HEPN domain